jgi:hypothetical protein
MTEEEIIKMLEHSINTYIEDTKVTKVELTTEQVQVLLDLYNKQKEDIMYFRMDVQELNDDIEFWKDRCDNSVDKYNIRNEIAKLEDKIKQCRKEYGNNTNEDYNWYLAQKRILEEIIKEY